MAWVRRFLRRRAVALCVAAALGTWLAYVPGRMEQLRAGSEPLSVELPVVTGGVVEASITIPVRTQYHLAIQFDRLAFERHGGSFDELKRLVGGMVLVEDEWRDTAGVPVPLRWTMYDQTTGTHVAEGYDADGGAERPVGTGWSRDEVSRVVADVTLEPGQYRFRAELLAPVPALARAAPRIALESWSKDAGNGAGPQAMAMAVYTQLLALPAFVVTLMYLAVMAVLSTPPAKSETASE